MRPGIRLLAGFPSFSAKHHPAHRTSNRNTSRPKKKTTPRVAKSSIRIAGHAARRYRRLVKARSMRPLSPARSNRVIANAIRTGPISSESHHTTFPVTNTLRSASQSVPFIGRSIRSEIVRPGSIGSSISKHTPPSEMSYTCPSRVNTCSSGCTRANAPVYPGSSIKRSN